jgi:hypothetical protein
MPETVILTKSVLAPPEVSLPKERKSPIRSLRARRPLPGAAISPYQFQVSPDSSGSKCQIHIFCGFLRTQE